MAGDGVSPASSTETVALHLITGRIWDATSYVAAGVKSTPEDLRAVGITHATTGFLFAYRNGPVTQVMKQSSFTVHHDHDHVWHVINGHDPESAALRSKYWSLGKGEEGGGSCKPYISNVFSLIYRWGPVQCSGLACVLNPLKPVTCVCLFTVCVPLRPDTL